MDTYFDPDLNPNPQVNYYIIDMKKGDVTGDGTEDEVYLLGTQPSGGFGPNYFADITIGVIDGKNKKTTYIGLKYNAGFNPKLTLEDFTSDNTKEIFVSIISNISTGEAFYYIFSVKDNNPVSLFNFMQFNEFNEYRVLFRDYYEVEIVGVRSNKRFTIDISHKGEAYLSSLYLPNGKLKRTIEGDVLPLGNLFPVDLNDDNVMELLAFQKIVGTSKTDVLGYIQTYLFFDGKVFVPGLVLVALPGQDVIPNVTITPNTKK